MQILSSIQDPKLVEQLQAGMIGVMPTDTIYGLCASANNPEAVARLYALKGHEQKPGTLIAANLEQLIALGLNEALLSAVAPLWPNPLSIIVPAPGRLTYLHLDLESLAVRIPADEPLRKLLEATGVLVTVGVNRLGEPLAGNVETAQRYFGDSADFYVDGGDMLHRSVSTVARYAEGKLEVLRPGAVEIDSDGHITANRV